MFCSTARCYRFTLTIILTATLFLSSTLTPYQLHGDFLQLILISEFWEEKRENFSFGITVLLCLNSRFVLSFPIIQILFCTCTVSAHHLSLAKMGTKLSCLIIPKHSEEKIANDRDDNSTTEHAHTNLCVTLCIFVLKSIVLNSYEVLMSIIWTAYGRILGNSRQLHFN